jgi:glutaredoxin
MIVPRGNCKFVPKALNAQKAGAKIVIIMDNETYSEQFTMADNGEGSLCLIQVIRLKFLPYS